MPNVPNFETLNWQYRLASATYQVKMLHMACGFDSLRNIGRKQVFNLISILLFYSAIHGTTEELRFMSRARQLIFDGARSGEGYFSADGQSMVFQSEREAGNPFYQIYHVDLSTGNVQRVSPGIGKTTCAFLRPGHNEVLFSSTHLDPRSEEWQLEELDFRASGKQRRYSWDYDPQMDIFTATHDGGNIKRLTNSLGYDAEASYSPDGSKIVFCSNRHAYLDTTNLSQEQKRLMETDKSFFGEIYIMDADGSNQTRLTYKDGYDGGPFFSPDGMRILWRRFDESGVNADIFTMSLDGSDTHKVTDFQSMSWAPYFHPSGEYVIFASNKYGFGNFELFIVDAAGAREPVRVTDAQGFDGLPVFSPDGNQISWTSNRTRDGKSQIFLARWNHQAASNALEASPKIPQFHPDIRIADLQNSVANLAADTMKGRLAGTDDSRKAAEYIAERLITAKVKGAVDDGYFHEYEFTRGVDINGPATSFTLTNSSGEKKFNLNEDYRPLPFSSSGKISGEVIFGGYGLALPSDGGITLDPYGGADVSGKIVLIFRYVPEGVSNPRRTELNRYSGLRYKAMIARQRGAAGLLVVTGPNSPGAGKLAGLSDDGSLSGSGIVAASISLETAEAILAKSDKSLKELQTGLDSENPHAANGFIIPDTKVSLEVTVTRKAYTDQNVIGIISPDGKSLESADGEYILLGAHYDHLGLGESGGSRQTSDDSGEIHNGADDNASGVALLLELADYYSVPENRTRLSAPLVLAFWGGEESGLLGSARFAADPPVPMEQCKAYLNFDMVGRMREFKLIIQGLGSSDNWSTYIERANIPAGLDLQLQDDPYLPTDTTSIYPLEIPVLSFFTGSHDDYHRPSDDPDTLNYEGLSDITKLARHMIESLTSPENPLTYQSYADTRSAAGSRDTLRIYLGTIPDYASETDGLRLTGVSEGGPASIAGIQAGDIIIELAGQKIKNIYDYTYAIDALKVDVPAEIVLRRGEKTIDLQIIPKAR